MVIENKYIKLYSSKNMWKNGSILRYILTFILVIISKSLNTAVSVNTLPTTEDCWAAELSAYTECSREIMSREGMNFDVSIIADFQ